MKLSFLIYSAGKVQYPSNPYFYRSIEIEHERYTSPVCNGVHVYGGESMILRPKTVSRAVTCIHHQWRRFYMRVIHARCFLQTHNDRGRPGVLEVLICEIIVSYILSRKSPVPLKPINVTPIENRATNDNRLLYAMASRCTGRAHNEPAETSFG